MAGYRLWAGWRAHDVDTLPALRTLYSYRAGRATGWLYSSRHHDHLPPAPWPRALEHTGPLLLAQVEEATGTRFTAAAFQAYLDGAGCSWHHDRDWGAQAIYSLGVTRSFGLRRADGEEWLRLAHGDLLYMPPGFQDEWEHTVPEEDTPGERCSVVFRAVDE